MANYNVCVYCDDCGEVHNTEIVLELADGPTCQMSVASLFEGKPLSGAVADAVNNYAVCPKTGKQVKQEDLNQVFFLPVS